MGERAIGVNYGVIERAKCITVLYFEVVWTCGKNGRNRVHKKNAYE